MELQRCPYDGSAIEAEVLSGGSLLVTCPECGAEWEHHGAWVRRLREPNRERVLAVREAAFMIELEGHAARR